MSNLSHPDVRATTLRGRYAEHFWQQGLQLQRSGRYEASCAAFAKACRACPADALLWINLAAAHLRLGELGPAERACSRAIELQPLMAVAWLMLGDSRRRRNAMPEAAEAYEEAERCGHEDVDAYIHHAGALQATGRPDRALQVLLKASIIQPHHAIVHGNLAVVFRELGLMKEAVQSLKTLQALAPGHLQGLSSESYEKRHLFDWADLDTDVQALTGLLEAADPARPQGTTCFALLSLPLDPALQRKAAELDAAFIGAGVQALAPVQPDGRRPGPLRIGYLSADFREHPVAQLMVEVLERRARGATHVTLYDHGGEHPAAVRQRLKDAADAFVNLDGLSDRDAAQRIRDDGIDVLVDLQGHTRNTRMRILSFRPAPIQASYLGFPGTTGDPAVDYLIADPFVVPAALAPQYREKIAQLPLCFQPNGRWRPLPRPMARSAVGLPDDAFVMCAFNHTYKILPAAFDAWAEVMRRVPRAVLWLKRTNAQLQENAELELARRGVDPARLHWAGHAPFDEHFSRLALADVFVDTWPYNAHTTAADLLWAGVPVVTVYGNSYASRVAASVLNAAGLPELAFGDPGAYVDALQCLAEDPGLLAEIRRHLEAHRMTMPLFDARARADELEALYLRMFDRWQKGLAPDHLWAEAPTPLDAAEGHTGVEAFVPKAVAAPPAAASMALA